MRATTRHWKVWVSLLAGAWLFVSPWILGFTAATTGTWAAYVLGAVVVLVAAWALTASEPRIADASLAVLGALVFATPWAIGYAGYPAARIDAWIVGAVIAVMSLWAMSEHLGRREARHPRPMA